ncbi:hypothetical protein GGH12_006270, partial [Coemansia sp. RSA 1822]
SSEAASAKFQVPAAEAEVYDKARSEEAFDTGVYLDCLDYLYQQTQEFGARCDPSIAEAQLTCESMENVIVQNQELTELLCGQAGQAAIPKEPLFKVFDCYVPELDDNPMAVEHWVQSAKAATASMPDKLAVSVLQDKLVGAQVHQLALIPYVKPQVLFTELIQVLSAKLNAKSHYLTYSPNDTIGQVQIDMSFLELDGTEHEKTCGEI